MTRTRPADTTTTTMKKAGIVTAESTAITTNTVMTATAITK